MGEDEANTQQRGGGDADVRFFFKAVVQEVLLSGLEIWAITPRMGKALWGFQDQVARKLTGWLPRRKADGKWKYTLAETARDDAGFLTTEKYIRRRQNTFAKYIATRSLLEICEGSERSPGAQVGMRWWEQALINLAGARETETAVTERDGGEE